MMFLTIAWNNLFCVASPMNPLTPDRLKAIGLIDLKIALLAVIVVVNLRRQTV